MNRSSLVSEAGQILSDVDDSFQTFDHITARLTQWKQRYGSAYSDAFVGLSVPGLVAPYVRLELLRWNPLGVGQAAAAAAPVMRLNQMQWYDKLFSFGVIDNKEPYVLLPPLFSAVVLVLCCVHLITLH
jgi:GC-rich sequence DNA-binding factor